MKNILIIKGNLLSFTPPLCEDMVCGWDGDIPEGAIVIEGDVVCKSITADLIYLLNNKICNKSIIYTFYNKY